jgi:hypothetical protein
MMKRMALAAFLAAAALTAVPSIAAKATAYIDAPAGFGSAADDPGVQRGPRLREPGGAYPGVERRETVPGAPDPSVFVLHRR